LQADLQAPGVVAIVQLSWSARTTMANIFKRTKAESRPKTDIRDLGNEPIPVPEVIESDPDTAWAIWAHTVETQDKPFESTESAPLATQPSDLNTQPADLDTAPAPLRGRRPF